MGRVNSTTMTSYKRTTRRVNSDPLFGTEPIAGIKPAKQASNAAGTASSNAGGYGTTAAGIGDLLVPTLKGDVNNAPGFSPEDVNNQLVAGEEGAGGTNAAIAGEAGLKAARSRNVGSTAGVLDEAARIKSRTNAGVGLDVANQNAMLKQQQRASALKQLQGLYGTDVSAQTQNEGLVPEDIDAWAKAQAQNPLNTAAQTFGGASGKLLASSIFG